MDFLKKISEKKQGTYLFSLGQAGFILKNNQGNLLGIDLYLSDCVERVEGHDGYKRLQPSLIDPKELVLDVLICTHWHRDHYDIDAIPSLMKDKKTHLFCAHDCEKDVKEQQIDLNRVTFVKPSDSFNQDGFNIHFVNCDHGQGAPLAVGVIVELDGLRVLEVGDTCLRLDRVDEYLSFGPIDVLIGPINGKYGNLSEGDFALLTSKINPKLVIPCHYGMFANHEGNPEKFRIIMQTKYPNINYYLMTNGDEYKL